MSRALWSFTAQVPASRADLLLAHESFLAVENLIAAARITEFTWEPYRHGELKGCNRAAFLVEVPSSSYDAFFNSPVGLRAQYAISPAQGEGANRRLLNALLPKLVQRAGGAATPGIETIVWSIAGSQAKIWIYEDEVQCQLGVAEPAIDYGPWTAASETGVGLLAPVGRCLHVMGGWINAAGALVSNPIKERRSFEIHSTGFS